MALGLSRSAIDYSVSRGRLVIKHRGVYAVAGLALPEYAAEQAAVLAVGEDSYLSHHSATAFWGMTPPPRGDVQVTLVDRDAGRRRPGIEVHQVQGLDRRDVTRRLGIPVVTAARALLDIAPDLSDRQLERMFDSGLKERRFSRHAVAEVVARNPRRPGATRLAALAATEGRFSTVTRSRPEETLLALVRAGGLPEPEVNVVLGPYIVDFLWRAEGLVVEVDGYEFHSTRRSFEADHARDVELDAEGFVVLRFTRDQIEKQPQRVLVKLAQRLAQLRGSTRTVV